MCYRRFLNIKEIEIWLFHYWLISKIFEKIIIWREEIHCFLCSSAWPVGNTPLADVISSFILSTIHVFFFVLFFILTNAHLKVIAITHDLVTFARIVPFSLYSRIINMLFFPFIAKLVSVNTRFFIKKKLYVYIFYGSNSTIMHVLLACCDAFILLLSKKSNAT